MRTECCPDGLTFNPETGTCDFEWTVPGCGCGPIGTYKIIDIILVLKNDFIKDICHGNNGEPLCGDPFPLDDNCTHYQQCIQGNVLLTKFLTRWKYQ